MKVKPSAFLAVAFIVALLPVIILIPLWVHYNVVLAEAHEHGVGTTSIEELEALNAIYIQQNKLPDGSIEAVPLPGENFLKVSQFAWTPNVIRLRISITYRFTVFSVDVVHGFSLIMGTTSFNSVIVPGTPATIHMTPLQAGTYMLLCNEYCGAGGHDVMTAKFIVE